MHPCLSTAADKLFAQFISIFAGAFAEAAKEVVKLGLDFKVVGVWVAGALNNTANSTQARQLLMQQGLDGLVIGVQVSYTMQALLFKLRG